MFDEIRDAWREFRAGLGSDVLALDLARKDQALGTFSTGLGDPDFYRKFPRIIEAFGGYAPSYSGEVVTDAGALTHSVVWACTRVISESVAFLPLSMYQQRGDSKVVAANHPCHSALHNAPNDQMSAMTFRELQTAQVVTRGNCYAKLYRRSGKEQVYELEPLDPTKVGPSKDKSGQLVYEVQQDRTYTVVRGRPHDILHIRGLGMDGVCGYSVITMARQSLGSAQALERYAAQYFAKGGRQPGALKLSQPFRTKQDEEKFGEDVQKTLQGSDNFHKWPIFPQNVTFEPYGWNPQDSQFLETRQWTTPEICRWFLISPHMVGDLSRATFSNIEHLALAFVKQTLAAWITRWEQDLWRCVLTPAEKAAGFYFRHNLNGLLRGDFLSRMQGYASMLQNGVASIDEIRDFEDWNPLPNGDGKGHRVQLNMQSISGKPTTMERVQLAKVQATQAQPIKAAPAPPGHSVPEHASPILPATNGNGNHA